MLALAREPLDHPWFAPGGPPVAMAIGSLRPVKDHQLLLRAFALVRRERDARLMILGDGPERGRLEGLIAELGLQDSVALPGFSANPYNYLAKAAVFVLSSISEALPTALIEALAVGTPVVATDCRCGPSEVLQGGRFGTLVPVGDAAALGKAILDALQGPRRDVPTEAVLPFSMDYALDQYCRLIAELTHG
jgi:glycosyltransferase involved in cell wall biosynthesis